MVREYDEKWIEGQLAPMLDKGWGHQEIAGWFARAGYENGKADMQRSLTDARLVEALRKIRDLDWEDYRDLNGERVRSTLIDAQSIACQALGDVV